MSRRLSEDADRIMDIELEHSVSNSTEAIDDAETMASEDENDFSSPAIESVNTPRMWTLSILFAILGSSLNLFFSLRYPSISISPILALLLSHPLGLFWDAALHEEDVTVQASQSRGANEESSPLLTPTDSPGAPRSIFQPHSQTRWRRIKNWLAKGRWNQKEHCCVFISSSVSFGFAFATDIIVEQTKFYNQDVSILYQILLTLSTQILGYALAGFTRSFLVIPEGMVWPQTLAAKAMLTSLHKNDNKVANGWKISRFKFFLYVFLGSGAFYFLPGLLFPALSYFNAITWFAPQNVILANLFGVSSGLGLFPVTFDWAQISFVGSPLITPFWAALNIFGGLFFVIWIIAPVMYYSNVMYSSYMPILSSIVFDNTRQPYNVTRILTKDFVFDEVAYKSYSRVFMPTTYILSYGLQFAVLPALIVHTFCWYGGDTWKQFAKTWHKAKDETASAIHIVGSSSHLSRQQSFASDYSRRPLQSAGDDWLTDADVAIAASGECDVPLMWYVAIGLATTGIGIYVVEAFNVHLPWYGLLLAIGICTALFIPIGIIQAITSQQISLYLVAQIVCGFLFAGRPVANMVFTTYSYITSTQGLKFASDLKLGQIYMGVPGKLLFKLQLVCTVISSFTQIGVLNWMLVNIPNICTPDAPNGLTCPLARVHFNGSILWGVIGPHRFFAPGELYHPLVWAFPLGALLPFVAWYFSRGGRHRFWSRVNFPVIFGSLAWIPPATALNFSVWFAMCWAFNDRIKNMYHDWWSKYTMTLSAGLDTGLAVGVVVIFFGLVYPGFVDGFKWWGTEVYKQGCDWQACPFKELPSSGYFGPSYW